MLYAQLASESGQHGPVTWSKLEHPNCNTGVMGGFAWKLSLQHCLICYQYIAA